MKRFSVKSIFRNSINKKFTTWFLIIGLIPLIILIAILSSLSSQEMMRKEQQSLQALTESTAQGMDQWLDRRLSEIQLAAKTDIMKSLNSERQLILVKQIKEQSDTYETTLFANSNGIVQAHTNAKHIGVLNVSTENILRKA